MNEQQIFKLTIEGNIPTDYIGKEMKTYFTTHPEKFQKEDCGNFEG